MGEVCYNDGLMDHVMIVITAGWSGTTGRNGREQDVARTGPTANRHQSRK